MKQVDNFPPQLYDAIYGLRVPSEAKSRILLLNQISYLNAILVPDILHLITCKYKSRQET